MSTFSEHLRALGACREAIEWTGDRDLATAWAECPRGDWLLWLAARTCEHGDNRHRAIVLAACECARTAIHLVPAGEDRPRISIETAESWARGDAGATMRDVQSAADASYTAVYAAAAAAASYAAADAASAAAADAADAADAAARRQSLSECADLVRRVVPCPVLGDAS